MKKKTQIMVVLIFMFVCLFTTVYATSDDKTNEPIKQQSTGKLLEIKKNETKNLEQYKERYGKYGSDTYGVTAYILDMVRIYSIPLAFIGIAISAIFQFVIGLKKLDVRDKGFNSMIAIITILVICQILPIIFTIVVTSTGNK